MVFRSLLARLEGLFEGSWAALGRLGGSCKGLGGLGDLGASWGGVVAILGASWGRSWGCLGVIFGRFWGGLGGGSNRLEASRGILGCLGERGGGPTFQSTFQSTFFRQLLV